MAENETTERFIADVEQYVRELQRAAREADRWSDRTNEAGERARLAGHRAAEAAERAERAQREAARAAEEYARGEGSAERAAQQAARAQRELERAEIFQARAARAAAKAADEQADELERLGREAARAAFSEEMARRRASGQTEHHNNLLRRLNDTFGDMSREGGKAFRMMEEGSNNASKSMQDMAGPGGIMKVAVILGLLPTLAQLAGTGIVLGVGGGLAALGIMTAAKSKVVKDAFSSLAKDVGNELKEMAAPFEPQLVRIAGIARRTFGELAPFIGDAFAKIAPLIGDFADVLGRSMKPFGPMIQNITAAFGPMIKALGGALPGLMSSLAAAITRVAMAADPAFIVAMVDGLARLITVISYLIVWLERAESVMVNLYGGMMKIASGAQSVWNSVTGGADRTTTALMELAQSQKQGGDAAAAWAAELMNLKAAMDAAAGKALSAREANRQYEQAVDEATEAVKKNGRTLDIHTQKGRDNQAVLDRIAQSALEARKRMDEKGTSDIKAARAADEARAAFVRTAMSMGMSRAAANRLADEMQLVRGSLLRVPSSKTIKFSTPGMRAAQAGADALRAAIAAIHDKTVRVTILTNTAHDPSRRFPGLGYAQGTDSAPPGMAWVGEKGPELMAFAGGEQIIDHLESMRIAAKANDPLKITSRKPKVVDGRGAYMPIRPDWMPKPPKPIFKQLPKAPAAATVTYVTHNTYEIRGSVWAEKELLDVIQRQAAKRNIRNPGLAQFGGR